jgi:ketosteroid isomerase-like protein
MPRVAARTSVEPDSDRVDILRIHDLWIRLNETWSSSDLSDIVTPDFVCFIGNGSVVRGREAMVDEWAMLAAEIDEAWKLDVFDRELRVVGDAAWITYEFHLVGNYDSEPFNEQGRGTEVYERRDGEWRMAVGHWSWRQR